MAKKIIVNDEKVIEKIEPILKKKYEDKAKQKYAKERFLSKLHRHIGDVHKALPDYHKFGLPLAAFLDVNHWVDQNYLQLFNMIASFATEETMPIISDTHKKTIFTEAHEALEHKAVMEGEPDVLDESIITPPASAKVIKAVFKPDTAAYAIGGAAFGFSADLAQHILTNAWEFLTDYANGRTTNIKAIKDYAKHVREHVDKRTKIMIEDLKNALEKEQWLRASRIQKDLRAYGQQTGYMYHEETEAIDEMGVGAASAAGAPTNNVGDGHIAGAAGDPPGGKNKLRRRILRRMKTGKLED
jgi:hypothetical protein